MVQKTLILCLFITSQLFANPTPNKTLGRSGKMSLTLDISPKASIGNTMWQNANIDGDPYAERITLSPCYAYGGRVGLTYMGSVPRYVFFSVYGEYMLNTINQSYQLKDYGATTPQYYTHGYKLGGTDKGIFFRLTAFTNSDMNSSIYFEVGSQTTTFTKFSETNSIEHAYFATNSTSYQTSSIFNPNQKNIVFGIGSHGNFFSMGLRCTYGLSDLMKNNNYPVNDGYYNSILNNDYYKSYPTNSYQPTHLLMVQLVMEINLYVLELGNATCGKKRFFAFPFHLNNNYLW